MVTAYIRKWGNSLAIRFPQSLLAQIGLDADALVELHVEEGRLIVSPIRRPKYSLEQLLAHIDPDYVHEEIGFGKPAGREVW